MNTMAEEGASLHQDAEQPNARNEQILIVAASQPAIPTIISALEGAGFEVFSTSTADSAAEIIPERQPDVLLLDADAPGLEKEQVIRSIRAAAEKARVPIIAMLPRAAPLPAALAKLVDEQLSKPFYTDELLLRVRRVAALAGLKAASDAAGSARYIAPDTSSDRYGVTEQPETYRAGSLVGTTLGEFRLVEFFHRGGIDEVYRAEHTVLGTELVVKVMPAAFLEWEPAHVERLFRGARAAASLDHPNIVPIIDAGRQDEYYYVVSKFIPGETIREILSRQGALPERDTLDIVTQIAEALEAAHAKKIIHRDVKPSNIIVSGDGRAWLTDFGLAWSMETKEITTTGQVVGTPHYMSPEQCDGLKLDGRADIYSLGATAYHMLVGRPHVEGGSVLEILHKQLSEVPAAAREINPEISEALSDLIVRMLAKKKERRPSSTTEVLQLLRAVER